MMIFFERTLMVSFGDHHITLRGIYQATVLVNDCVRVGTSFNLVKEFISVWLYLRSKLSCINFCNHKNLRVQLATSFYKLINAALIHITSLSFKVTFKNETLDPVLKRVLVIFEVIHYGMSWVRVNSLLADKLQHFEDIEYILVSEALEVLEEADWGC